MTVLSQMQARIADDLARPDLTTQIAAAINDAIAHYQSTRLYFTETRTATFPTVAGQWVYTGTDSPYIPLMYEFDDVLVTLPGNVYSLYRDDATALEQLNQQVITRGDPQAWAWADQNMLLYPIPSAVRTIRLLGGIKKAAPIDDSDPANVWMNDGFELIRCHAEGLLFQHTIRDSTQSAAFFQLAELAKARLERETSSKRATGTIAATQF